MNMRVIALPPKRSPRKKRSERMRWVRSVTMKPSIAPECVATELVTERHRILSRLSALEQGTELQRGVRAIRTLTGQESVPFSYPYGHKQTYNAATLALLEREGFAGAFTTIRASVRRTDSLYELPRMDTKDLPPFVPHFPLA
jgi:peptidoglycan/xylan/chitin deacetylase (PgdA/CDA1 family)